MSVQTVSVTVLSDNRAAYGLEAEHGLSFWIEAAGNRILFDTGQGEAMPRNVESLGLDVGDADAVVLSHGHYDHSGNVPWAMSLAPHARLYLHPDALCTRYSIRDAPKANGMPRASAQTVTALPEARRRWVSSPTAVCTSVWLTGPVPRVTEYEDTGGPFYLDAAGACHDDIPDDLSLWIQTRAGLVVCLGCCHAGVINTLHHITEAAHDTRIIAVIGGMHLLHAKAERLERTADALRAYAVPHVLPCHCTGDHAVSFLADRFGTAVQQGYAGMKVTF
jgi:7,8-dihydropterin-6-yl-methyl-4-(beta-D-ribofuranosyl)aminobenzene 5'-phosphate synthase